MPRLTKTYRVISNGLESLLTVERRPRHRALGGGVDLCLWLLIPGVTNKSVSVADAKALLRSGGVLTSIWNGYSTTRTRHARPLV